MKSSKKSSQLSHNLQYQKNDEKLNYTNDCKLSKLINWITSQTWSKMLRVSIKIPCKRRSSLRKMIELALSLSPENPITYTGTQEIMMWETQEDFYLVLFMFASQLYFYALGPSSLLAISILIFGSKIIICNNQNQGLVFPI